MFSNVFQIMAQGLDRLLLEQEQLRLMHSLGFYIGLMIVALCMLGAVFVLYTAAGGWLPWALPHAFRTLLGVGVIGVMVLVPLPVWFRYAYLLYTINVLLLLLIPLFGTSAMGAQRWFTIGPFFLQPSEPMKLFTIMALARYFHVLGSEETGNWRFLLPPLAIAFIPLGLTIIQPDLGTAVVILLGAGIVFFLAGVRWWKFAGVFVAAVVSAPLVWQYMLHDFQKMRILSFINPQDDLLGSGYQLMQSKIAIGAGGLFGQGFLAGTQSILGFIPAKHTDFVFSLYAEQFGLVGSAVLLAILLVVLSYGFQCAQASRSTFGKLLAMSVVSLWIAQSVINLAMVMGMLPVVGIPLPFFSYGGTSLWTTLAGFGLVLNVYLYQYHTLRQIHR